MLTRGTGRARGASAETSCTRSKACGLSAAGSANMLRRRSLADSRRLRSRRSPKWRISEGPHLELSTRPATYLPHTISRRSPDAASRRADRGGPRGWRPLRRDCAGWRSPCWAKACYAVRGRHSPTNPAVGRHDDDLVDKTAARAPMGRHCRNRARVRPIADRCRRVATPCAPDRKPHGRRFVRATEGALISKRSELCDL